MAFKAWTSGSPVSDVFFKTRQSGAHVDLVACDATGGTYHHERWSYSSG